MERGFNVADDAPPPPAMTSAELQTAREYLGLSTLWLAEKLVLNERRISRMESGQEPVIPPVLTTLIDQMLEETQDEVARLIAIYRRKAKGSDEPLELRTFRTDVEYSAAGGKYPARWHRHLCARVIEAVPNLMLVHTDPQEIVGVHFGEILAGTVTNVTEFGIFVKLGHDTDGMIHISQVDPGKRVNDISKYAKIGDKVTVEVLSIDGKGRIGLKLC